MMVGITGTGKTTILNILKNSLQNLNKMYPKNQDFYNTECFLLNPKSVNTNYLYGYINKLTDDWNDGIIAKVIRNAINNASINKNWIIMDGPVDTLWVESLNTVLDDNKMLCLSNG